MATTPTNLPIPSEDPRDLKFNAGKFDEVMTSDAHYYTDRFGKQRWTIAGFQFTAKEAIRNYGYITLKSFQLGAPLPNNELTLPNQVLQDETDGQYYRWDGDFPKAVAAGSTPTTTGGVGLGAWLSVGDADASNLSVLADGSSVPRALGKRFGDVGNSKDNGAVGDGIANDKDPVKATLLKSGIIRNSGSFTFPLLTNIRPDDYVSIQSNTDFSGGTYSRPNAGLIDIMDTEEDSEYITVSHAEFREQFDTLNNNDYAGFNFRATKSPIMHSTRFNGVENGVGLFGYKFPLQYGGWRNTTVTENASLIGIDIENPREYGVQQLGAKYSKMIGLSIHNNGDKTNPSDGNFSGVRFAGKGESNTISSSIIRDLNVGVSFQLGNEYPVVGDTTISNMNSHGIVCENNFYAPDARVSISNAVVKDIDGPGVVLRHSNHSAFSGIVSNCSSYPIDLFPQSTNDKHFIKFTSSTGNVPSAGAIISQGSASGTLVEVFSDDWNEPIEAGEALPSLGWAVITKTSAETFKAGALTGIDATSTGVSTSLDGRHRIDATVTESRKLRVASNSNLVNVVVTGGSEEAIVIDGDRNLVNIVIADSGASSGFNIRVNGNKNVISISGDDSLINVISVSGDHNSVRGCADGFVAVGGDYNSIDMVASGGINLSGSDNKITGRYASVSNSGSNNDVVGIYGRSASGQVTATTTASGSLIFKHGLNAGCTAMTVNVSSGPYFAVTQKLTHSLTESLVKIYDTSGATVNNTSVTISYIAHAG